MCAQMKVVVLCGGLGTRLREETEFRPKPMVEIGGRPILWHLMKLLGHQGLKDFVLCLGYRGNMIKEYFLNYEAMNNDLEIQLGSGKLEIIGKHSEQDYVVRLVDTGAHTQTGARVKRVEGHLGGCQRVLVTYGDGLANIDVAELVAFHGAHGKLATITTVQSPSRFGVVETDDTMTVVRFREKPSEQAWVNAGFMIFERRVFEYLSEHPDCVLEHEPLERLARDGQLMAYRHHGAFHPMDTYRDHLLLNQLWSTGQAPWKTW
jgi:glucose-1-phosphate cytidylyltransferase